MIEKLASKLGRNDEEPNIELAIYLCQNNDTNGIKEIANGFNSKDKAISSNCIKVLYEIGERKPELIKEYAKDFIHQLHSGNNRLAWGSMLALSKIADLVPDIILEDFDLITSAYECGSAITVDNSMIVFAKICKANKEYSKSVFPIILKHLEKCRPNEIARHAEKAEISFNSENAKEVLRILEERITALNSSGQTRINKLIKRLKK